MQCLIERKNPGFNTPRAAQGDSDKQGTVRSAEGAVTWLLRLRDVGTYSNRLAAMVAELSSGAACPFSGGKVHKLRPSEGKQSPQAGFSGTLGKAERQVFLREHSMGALSEAQFTGPAEPCSVKVKGDDPARSKGNSTSPSSHGG